MAHQDQYTILNNISDSVLVIDQDYTIVFANHHFLDLCATSTDKIVGGKCYQVLHHSPFPCADKNIPDWQCIHKQVFETGIAATVSHQHLMPNGSKRFFEISASPIKDDNGSVVRLISIIKDISAQEELRAKLDATLGENEAILNNAPFTLSYLDCEMRIVKLNAPMEHLVGHKSEEVQGRHCYDVWGQYAQDDSKRGRERICDGCKVQYTLTDGRTYSYERQAGERYVEVTTSPVKDKDGHITGSLECGQDITQRKLAEEALVESRKRYQTLFARSADAIFVSDMEGRLIDANEQACQSLGYTFTELTALTVPEVDQTASTQDFMATVWPQLDNGSTVTRESVHTRKDGSCFPVEIHIGMIEVQGQDAILGIARDITDRKKAEYEVVKAKEEWERTFNAMSDIVTIQDREMRIVRANKAAHDFFEVNDGGLVGRHCYEVFRGISEPCLGCPLLETLEDVANHSEVIHHENLGKIFLVSSAATTDKNGATQFLVHIAKDITEQKKLEEELFQSHKMEAIGTLAGGIAHDFNNILTAIVGFTELAQMRLPADSNVANDLAEVLQASQRATGLVKQILSFSRKGAHKREPLQPYLIAKEAMKLMRASLPTTIEILENIDPESGSILGDPTNIHQIMVNLCTNALHAMEEETGTLKVTMLRRLLTADDVAGHPGISAGPFIELAVSDSGCGMDPQTQQRIFEPYFTTRETGKGTGLGLAVVLGIVQDYGGMITVDSESGRGTTFHVYFPAIIEEAKKPEVVEEVQPLPSGTERILTVDDEGSIVALQKAILSQLGYSVTAETSSEEALAAFKDDPQGFDLLITDQTMPALSGAKLAKEVLDIRPDMPIILCTGYSSTLSEEGATAIGIKKYLMKPVEIKDLARTVREVLDG